MGLIRFDIRYPNGQRESTEIDGERALIGSASYSDVRLPVDQAAYEQVVVELHGDTLRAEAKTDDPPATINGMPLTASPLATNSVLGIGNIKLLVTYVPDAADGRPAAKAKEKKAESSPTIRLLILLLGGAAALLALFEEPSDIAPPPAEAPELFQETKATCQQKDPTRAHAMASELMDSAFGKQERMPFAAHEGVAAVDLYEQAAACFRTGGDGKRAKEAEEFAGGLRHTLVDDFRARRLRMKHMLAVKDYELVRKDVAVLQALTAGKSGPYVKWLASVKKQLDARGVR